MKNYLFAAALGVALIGGGVAIAQPGPDGASTSSKKMKADRNRDGVITRDEAMAAAGRKFDKKDRNRDGKLDSTEMARKGGKGGDRYAANGMVPQADDGE